MQRNGFCELCPLHLSTKHVCLWGQGDDNPEVMVIGEASTREEDNYGRPFVGPQGNLIKEQLLKAGFKSVYVTNLVKCRPPDRPPTAKEVKICKGYLDEEIRRLKPKYVITLGSLVSKTILKKSKITEAHGQLVTTETFTGMPLYQPSYVIRDPSKLPALTHDLARFRREIDGTSVADPFKYTIAGTWELIGEFLNEFKAAEEFSFDKETSGLFPHNGLGAVRCLGIGLKERAWVIPLDMPGSLFENRPKSIKALGRLLQSIAKGKIAIAQNGKFDNEWGSYYLGGRFYLNFDTMLAHHILDENQPHDLKYLSRVELDCPEYDLSKKEKTGGTLHILERRLAYLEYCARDAWNTLRLKWVFEARLRKDKKLRRLFYSLVMPAARTLEVAEMEGLTLDLPRYAKTEEEAISKRDGLLAQLRQLSPKTNWNSPAQVAKVLFDDLGLPCKVRTAKGAASTGETALVDLKGLHPVADTLIAYRETEKFIGTYLEGWKDYIYDGRLYLGYKIHGTVTGRYSSRLHQVPRDGSIRNLVVAPEGWEFVQADLSQAELRIAAEMSGDLELISCFRPGGQDVHWRTLMNMLGSGATDATELCTETAKLYCLQQEVPSDRAGCEVLQEVWESHKDRESTKALLDICREVGKDKESGRWKRWKPERLSQSILERWNNSKEASPLEEKALRALLKYAQLSSTSQESYKIGQPKVQFANALPLLSCATPSIAQEFFKDWKEWRKRAKAVNFGYVFGMYENKFIETCKTKYGYEPTWEEAHAFRQAYFELYRSVPEWHDKQKRLVRLYGEVSDLFGRVRRLPGIYSSDRALRSECERQAINSPVQGTIGDWKAAAMVEIAQRIDWEKLRLVGEHHDALLMVVRKGCETETLPVVRSIMRTPKLLETFKINMRVPMESEIELGPWGAGKKYED